MSHLLQRILSELILPPFGPVLLIWLGIWVSRHRPRVGWTIAATSTAALFVLSLSGIQVLMRSPWPVVPDHIGPPYPPADAIVVLGGGRYLDAPEYGGDTASAGTLERVRYAAKLYRETGKPILVSGGRPGGQGKRTEAEIMREILEREFATPVTWAETESEDTRENIANSAHILVSAGVQRVYLVTDGHHVERATRAFYATGIEPVPLPTAYVRRETLTVHSWTPSFNGLAQNRAWLYEKLAAANPF